MIRALEHSKLVMEEVTDPLELAQARARRAKFDRNWSWLEAHAPEIYAAYRGKVICVSGQEVFAGETSEEAVALAKQAHPEDDGDFTLYIPVEKVARIYASQWSLVRVP